MAQNALGHVFGPVPSRRLGRSLGVDLVPFKVCPYDCIYCQLGRTTKRTVERADYAAPESILAEIDRAMESSPGQDVITLSGSGEPTLYSRIGELIPALKSHTGLPVAVLTNGSLLWDPRVREDLAEADIVLPSLDAGDERLFRYVNRPHPAISFERMVRGLQDFRKAYTGQIWLEVFLLAGVTAMEAEVRSIAKIAHTLSPDRVQLNTVTRPPAEGFAHPVPPERMESLAAAFGGAAEVLGVARIRSKVHRPATRPDKEERIQELIRRRPCTLEDIASGLGIHPLEALKLAESLVRSGQASTTCHGSETFYVRRL